MLWSAPNRKLRQIASTADETAGGRPAPRPKSKQSLKGGHRRLPSVMAKDEFVEIDLQVMPADAVIRADEPLLQVPDRTVRQRHHGGHSFAERTPERLRAGHMPHAGCPQISEAFQAVGIDRRAGRDLALDEIDHRRLFEVGDDRHPHTTRDSTASFHGHQHNGRLAPFELPTASQSRLRPADPRVVDLDVAMQGLAGGIDHRAPELVQDQPGRLVPADGQLALQQQGRDPPLVRRHQIRGPKPQRQRSLRPVEDRPGRQRHLVAALGAFTPLPVAQRERPVVAAARTSKAIGPATGLQIRAARRLVSELPLELPEAGRERRAGHGGTLLMVAS